MCYKTKALANHLNCSYQLADKLLDDCMYLALFEEPHLHLKQMSQTFVLEYNLRQQIKTSVLGQSVYLYPKKSLDKKEMLVLELLNLKEAYCLDFDDSKEDMTKLWDRDLDNTLSNDFINLDLSDFILKYYDSFAKLDYCTRKILEYYQTKED